MGDPAKDQSSRIHGGRYTSDTRTRWAMVLTNGKNHQGRQFLYLLEWYDMKLPAWSIIDVCCWNPQNAPRRVSRIAKWHLMESPLFDKGFSCISHRHIDRGDPYQIYRQLYTGLPELTVRELPHWTWCKDEVFTEKLGCIDPMTTMLRCFSQGRAYLGETSISVVGSATSEIA